MIALKLEALTPRDDLHGKEDSFKVYKDYLDDAFDNPKIRNLALSGSLGSGKSSIIRSYDRARNYGKKHFLYVSLMSFSNQNSETPTDDQKQLEYSLLNQIMSCCTSKDLPEGSINGIPEKFKWLRTCSLWLSALCLSIYMLVFHSQFGKLSEKLFKKLEGEMFLGFDLSKFFSESTRSCVHIGLYVFVGVTISFFVFCILRRCLPFLQLSKLTVKANNAEAEVLMGKERTSLDVYKFELAYALEKIGKNYDYTVVFEDLERLDPSVAVDIMEKLRELNTLTNNHIHATKVNRLVKRLRWGAYKENLHYSVADQCKPKSDQRCDYFNKLASRKHIRFVYAISEKTVPAEYRTKFYDCIIPVVPVSHPLNSSEKFSKMLTEFGFDSEDKTKLCKALSDAFVDYRTRLTLQNEFQVLQTLCETTNAKEYVNDPHNKVTLFAITAYKVLLPECFEFALSPQGTKSLDDFSPDDKRKKLEEYLKKRGREKAIDAVRNLFEKNPSDNTSLLDNTSLRLILGEHELVKQWMTILQNSLDRTTITKDDEERIRKVTENLADYFRNNKANSTQEPYVSFRQTMIKRLHQLTTKECETQFILVSNSMAAVSNNNVAGDWAWKNHDLLKKPDDFSGFLRNYICWLFTESSVFYLPPIFYKEYTSYFRSILEQCCNTQKDGTTGWDDELANNLVKVLYAENHLFYNHSSTLANLVIVERTIGDRLADFVTI